ncbi:hypothetical protein EVAR_35794_1 [Eumeta japonica]|uniref:Uncharacterized protein n=1 Tax=Eumeta variegata TaxID=151549 RepID=A0A4C1WR61_EUMVA|nr:hypothetical protein EVAR_35794_1 [Eumeta japonica]
MGVGTGRRTYILPHARASSRRGHDPDGSSGNGPYLMDPLVGIVPEPIRRPTRGRARSSRMRSRQVEGGIRLELLVLVEGGREAQNKLHTQPTAGGRTLVDANRIKAARIGDPPRAVRVSEPCPSTSSFCLILGRDVNPVPTPDHPRARASPRMRSASGAPGCEAVVDEGGGGGALLDRRTQTTAARRKPMSSDHVEAAPTGDSAAAPEAARVSEQLSSSSSGPRQGGLSDRRGAPRSIGSQLE